MTDDTKSILEQGIEACVKQLQDFGYPSVNENLIRLAHQNWKAGKEPEGVIEMFAFKDFEQYPNIFE